MFEWTLNHPWQIRNLAITTYYHWCSTGFCPGTPFYLYQFLSSDSYHSSFFINHFSRYATKFFLSFTGQYDSFVTNICFRHISAWKKQLFNLIYEREVLKTKLGSSVIVVTKSTKSVLISLTSQGGTINTKKTRTYVSIALSQLVDY